MNPTRSRRIFAKAFRLSAAMLCPNILTPPADAGSSPARQYSSVDFPEPDGPTIATISPGFTWSDTLRSTATGGCPFTVSNVFSRFTHATSGDASDAFGTGRLIQQSKPILTRAR